jgi:hypothetical protein
MEELIGSHCGSTWDPENWIVSKARHTRSMDVVTAYDFRLTLRTPLRCVALRTPAVMELNTLPHGLSVDDEAALLYEEQRRCRTVLLSNMVAELQGLAAASLLARLQAYGEIESLSVTPSGGAEAVFATLEQAEGAAAALDNSKTDWRFGQRAKLAAVKPATNRRVRDERTVDRSRSSSLCIRSCPRDSC